MYPRDDWMYLEEFPFRYRDCDPYFEIKLTPQEVKRIELSKLQGQVDGRPQKRRKS